MTLANYVLVMFALFKIVLTFVLPIGVGIYAYEKHGTWNK